jgi:hypothetical protein
MPLYEISVKLAYHPQDSDYSRYDHDVYTREDDALLQGQTLIAIGICFGIHQ